MKKAEQILSAKVRRDPLAGLREAINKGEGTSLFLPDPGGRSPCPVEIGQVFTLRACGVEITTKQRVRKDGKPQWRVGFLRIRYDDSKRYLLKRGGGYTHDPKLAMRSQDDLQVAATLDIIHPDARSEAHRAFGEPPEPEGPPPHEVASLSATMKARLKHREQQAAERAEQNARADARRVGATMRDVAARAARLGVDSTPIFAALEREIKNQERRLREAA